MISVDKILSDRASYEAAFEIKIDGHFVQFIEDVLEEQIRAHVRGIGKSNVDLDITVPVWAAAGAILFMKGLVKRQRGRQRDSLLVQREMMQERFLSRPPAPPAPDPMMTWARDRYKAIRAAERIKAGPARERAAKEAKDKFGSTLSWVEIGKRMERPDRFP
jgi:hypothetical protein